MCVRGTFGKRKVEDVFIYIYIYIILFIFGCAKSSLLCWRSLAVGSGATLAVVCRLLIEVASLVKYWP